MTAADPYATLREQIEAILNEGRHHSRQAGQWQKVETYWHVGDALLSHVGGQLRADYGQQVIPRLGADLGLGADLLWDLLRFRRVMPTLVTYRDLTWSHVRKVLPLPSHQQRRFYLQRANAESWSVRQLGAALGADAFTLQAPRPYAVALDDDPNEGNPLRAQFGQLWTYHVLPDGDPTSRDAWIDLGFTVAAPTDLQGIERPRAGMVVTSAPVVPGRYSFAPRPLGTRRYTYVAWPIRIIDGDTIIAHIDLGFGLKARGCRLRLRGIDCPELGTVAGRNARAFVEQALSDVNFVVLSTHRTDSFGRYLADVRYMTGAEDPEVVRTRGTYLNLRLLQERLARRYTR